MQAEIITKVASENNINEKSIKSVLKLLEEGCTIPFIARYRKEQTGNLDEDQIKLVAKEYDYQVNLAKRKEDVIRLIDEKGMLTDKITAEINNAKKITEVDEIYYPYREKKKTKATEAAAKGLEPLAKRIMAFPEQIELEKLASEYVNASKGVNNIEEALEGAGHIIAEFISDNTFFRKYLRKEMLNNGQIVSKIKRNAQELDPKKVYEIYYDFKSPIKKMVPYRTLAVNRAEKEKIVNVKIEFEKDQFIEFVAGKVIKKDNGTTQYIVSAIEDAYKRLMAPSIERELRVELTKKAEDKSIPLFANNLYNLVMQPPFKKSTILGIDPAFASGCKLAVIDETGKRKYVGVVYPTAPRNDIKGATKEILRCINEFNVDLIAIGNGTASRETEQFISQVISENNINVKFIIANESGASVYSASELAKKEFPDLSVEQRSAISIARRIQDPLSEYVKVDPKSIGVGQYQHDINQKELGEALEFTVEKIVNNIGVNINTAGIEVLKYISGLNRTIANNIVTYRDENGSFTNRKELKKVKGLGPKAFEQSIGFLRIIDGENPLDQTAIHPDNYADAKRIVESLDCKLSDLGSEELINKLKESKMSHNDFEIDVYTFSDIIDSLKKPVIDPRDEIEMPILKAGVLEITDLKEGMEISGTVRNIVDFGAFVDIGLKNDALIHISNMSNKFISNPQDVLAVGDIVNAKIKEVDMDKQRVGLTLI